MLDVQKKNEIFCEARKIFLERNHNHLVGRMVIVDEKSYFVFWQADTTLEKFPKCIGVIPEDQVKNPKAMFESIFNTSDEEALKNLLDPKGYIRDNASFITIHNTDDVTISNPKTLSFDKVAWDTGIRLIEKDQTTDPEYIAYAMAISQMKETEQYQTLKKYIAYRSSAQSYISKKLANK